MSNKKQSDNHNNRINTGNKKGNKKTLIINKLPNLVDTSQLVEKFKNCYCGKTIVVDLIKCSCNKFSERGAIGFKEHISESNSTEMKSDDFLNSSSTDVKPNEHKYTCVKKNSAIDHKDRYLIYDTKPVIHDPNNNPEVTCNLTQQIGELDEANGWNEIEGKKLKLIFKIIEPKIKASSEVPVTNIDLKIKAQKQILVGESSSDNQSNSTAPVTYKNESRNNNHSNNKKHNTRNDGKMIEKPKKSSNQREDQIDNSSLSFHSITNQSRKNSFEQLDKNNNATSVNYYYENEDNSSNQFNSSNLASTPAQKVPEHKNIQRNRDDNTLASAAEADDKDSRLGLGPKNSRWAFIKN